MDEDQPIDPEHSEEVRAALLRAVETQVRDGDPPETAQTLERLMGEGYPRDEAVRLIGFVLADELFQIMKQEREYDHERFVRLLTRLPETP